MTGPKLDLGPVLADNRTKIVVTCGSGGVGKTTTAAAMALWAADAGRKVAVLTIDPAKRLAQSLGLEELDNNPRRVDVELTGDGGELWAMTGTIDVLKAIAEGRGPSRWVAALGYAGWEESQLEEEMTRHGWLAADADAAILFDTPTEARWSAAFKSQGVDPRLLSSETGVA